MMTLRPSVSAVCSVKSQVNMCVSFVLLLLLLLFLRRKETWQGDHPRHLEGWSEEHHRRAAFLVYNSHGFLLNAFIKTYLTLPESGGRKLNENKALTAKKARFDPYGKSGFATCRICKSSVHQSGSHYCQGCAYKKGICAMCGKKVLDTKNYKQTSV
uniref:Cysteine-rich PDZ-binding protein n=1 Tax=Denticeps clupeoides TaxID=299321 RepID=A0AAY4C4L3_9TELE